jgi:DnaJ-class molecular chaperone
MYQDHQDYQGPSLCPSCGGYGDNGPHFPCADCLGGGYYLSPNGQYLSLYPKPGYSGPYYQFPPQGTDGN